MTKAPPGRGAPARGPGDHGLVAFFARHPTAANLVMLVMIVAGLAAGLRLNTQFFPELRIDYVNVEIEWPGASAEDVDLNIIQAVDAQIRGIDRIKEIQSFAFEGVGRVVIEFEPGSDMAKALSDVETAVSRITTFPEDIETPVVSKIDRYDRASEIMISGPFPERSLKAIAKEMRDDLLDLGAAKVDLFGLREEEILVEVEPATLRRLDLTLADIAARIDETSRDVPSGLLRGAGVDRQVRSIGRLTTAEELREIEVRALSDGRKIFLSDVATVREGFDRDAVGVLRDDQPAVILTVQRAQSEDILDVARTVDLYLEEVVPSLPPGLRVEQFSVASQLVEDRIDVLVRNGLGGLVLVVAVLFIFLNARVAFWVALGIPVSVLAALAVMWASGQTINMISLFGLIMVIGIVVDDAIVVGEHAAHLNATGRGPLDSAISGAARMLAPVSSASLTTVAAFTPLFLISGIIGDIIMAIPLVVVAVLMASLLECFVVLPHHLAGALSAHSQGPGGGLYSRFRDGFDAAFSRLRDGPFRRLVAFAVNWRYATLAAAFGLFLVSAGLVAGGRVGFHFFPTPESDTLFANVEFVAGTPRSQTEAMTRRVEDALDSAVQRLGENPDELVTMVYRTIGGSISTQGVRQASDTGDHIGAVMVELIPSDRRTVRTEELIAAWRAEIQPMGGLRSVTVMSPAAGPPGRDIDVRLIGDDLSDLKRAADEVSRLLARYPGISDVDHDLPEGKPETLIEVTPRGRALGFTTRSVGQQVRHAFEGAIADRFTRGDEEVTVRVRYPEDSREAQSLESLYLQGPGGAEVPLLAVAELRDGLGLDRIPRQDGRRQVAVTAELDETVTSTAEVLEALVRDGLAAVARDHELRYRFAGRAEEEGDTFADMKLGAMLGLVAIYIILAWIFASFSRPIAVMAVIPLGFVGAVGGHLLLGYDLTVMSLISLIGLAGIVVNDSIVLVTNIDRRRQEQEARTAIIEGTCDRLRAVLLTSATTIGGLTPLMFETSLQAQFLKPMALTIVAGLAVATLLVLLVVPAFLAVQDDLGSLRRNMVGTGEPGEPAAPSETAGSRT